MDKQSSLLYGGRLLDARQVGTVTRSQEQKVIMMK